MTGGISRCNEQIFMNTYAAVHVDVHNYPL